MGTHVVTVQLKFGGRRSSPWGRDGHRIELTTARILAEIAEDLLLALDDHRTYVLYKLAVIGDSDPSQTAWPF